MNLSQFVSDLGELGFNLQKSKENSITEQKPGSVVNQTFTFTYPVNADGLNTFRRQI